MKKGYGNIIKALRAENKLSQAKLASMVGVTQQCVSEWEKESIEPTLSNLWALADIFSISIDVLVGRKEY
ncbi:MAG: helix-turn-helix transcriptional regulator [Clostridia bacterium]|nr:helix-turn-helix transcriptional regulator [Clostridia bacterium]